MPRMLESLPGSAVPCFSLASGKGKSARESAVNDTPIHATRKSLEVGFYHIARLLNDLSTTRRLSVEIDIPEGTEQCSRKNFEHAKRVFRAGLPAIRTLKTIPADDATIAPWTLGYINGRTNPPCLISVVADYDEAVSKPLAFLAGRNDSNWNDERCVGRWKADIVDPVIDHHVKWRQWFDELTGKGLLPRPPGKMPKRTAEHPEWRAWEAAICKIVNARSIGAGACWDKHQSLLQDIAGVRGLAEFKRIHARFRTRISREEKI